MAYQYTWPTTLPQVPQKGFTEQHNANIIRAQMDAGIAKQRLIGKSPRILDVSYVLSSEQLSTLESFVFDTIKGVLKFGYTHPRTDVIEEVRIVPGSGGNLYTVSYLAPDYWSVSLKLEVLP